MTEREARERRAAAYSAKCRRERRARERRREAAWARLSAVSLAAVLLLWTVRLLTL